MCMLFNIIVLYLSVYKLYPIFVLAQQTITLHGDYYLTQSTLHRSYYVGNLHTQGTPLKDLQ